MNGAGTPAPCPPETSCGPTIFAPPGRLPTPLPGLDLASLTRLLTQLPAVAVQSSPYHGPPYRAVPVFGLFRNVVNVPLAFDAAANAGGVALANAEALGLLSPAPAPLPIVTPTVVGGLVQLQPVAGDMVVTAPTPGLLTPDNEAGVLTSLRVSAGTWEQLRALRVSVFESGRAIVSDLDPSVAAEVPAAWSIYLELKARQVLTVSVKNLDPRSAVLVEVALSGWRWPIYSPTDSATAALQRQDPGLPEGWQGRPPCAPRCP